MVIEAAKGGHTQVVKLLLEYPNRMLMNTQQDLPQITASDSHLVEVGYPLFQMMVWKKLLEDLSTAALVRKGCLR